MTTTPFTTERAAAAAQEQHMGTRIDLVGLTAYYGDQPAVADVDMTIQPKQVTAMIGPSGCGKSTLLRCINAMHLTARDARVDGQVLLDGQDVYAPGQDPVVVRQHVGMVFQRANPFPTMSIYQNVIAGIALSRRRVKRTSGLDALVEESLTSAGLWREVKDRLDKPGYGLSGGQQQRLCIARALAVQPQVLLMDEPCSALDPISTLAVEETLVGLKERYTIVVVTHNMQQAARISDVTAFLTVAAAGEPGRVVEVDETSKVFSNPSKKATEDYITGRFG